VKRRKWNDQELKLVMAEVERDRKRGVTARESLKKQGVSQTVYYRWLARLDGPATEEQRRIRELERENAKLRKLVADQALDIAGLKDLASGNF
jgi:hypothetical protein